MTGLTLGIVGCGELGRGVARAADAFELEVVVAQRIDGAALAAALHRRHRRQHQ